MTHYYEMGRASALLHAEYSGNDIENETIMKAVIRIIKVVSDYEEEENGEEKENLNRCYVPRIRRNGRSIVPRLLQFYNDNSRRKTSLQMQGVRHNERG